MEESEIIAATLNNTIARHAKNVQSYEIEIANLTAEIIRLQKQMESLSKTTAKVATKEEK